MGYYFSKTIATSFDEAIQRATEALKKAGFGIITEIDVRDRSRRSSMPTSVTTAYSAPATRRWRARRSRSRTRSAPCCPAT